MSDAMDGARACPWCMAIAAPDAANCSACGAALAQRETLGGVAIAGVTALDPARAAVDGRPIHLGGPSPSQGMASGVVAAAMIGGPVGAVALGGIAAVAAAEYLGARRPGMHGVDDLASVGRPSELARLAAERLDREGGPAAATRDADADPEAGGVADPWRDLPRG